MSPLRILVLSTDSQLRHELFELLKKLGYECIQAQLLTEALLKLEVDHDVSLSAMPIDIVVVPLETSELKHVTAVRDSMEFGSLPIVAIGARSTALLQDAQNRGATDCLLLPFDAAEAQMRLAAAGELVELRRTALSLARVDALTGLRNRRSLIESLTAELKRALRECRPLSVLLVDTDQFAGVHALGHSKSDEWLRRLSSELEKSLNRPADFVARYSPQEFAVILPGTPAEGAHKVGETLRRAIERIPDTEKGWTSQLSVSVGLATADPRQSVGAEGLLAAASKALILAQRDGGNRVISSLVGSGVGIPS
jgi:diguanylate cyclase (GGDEF)-like protein